MYYTYILKSLKNNDLYIGSTQDLEKRVALHNAGRIKSTQFYRPWQLLDYEVYNSRSGAVLREKFLKNHQQKEILKKKIWPGGEEVTRLSAKQLCRGSNPLLASRGRSLSRFARSRVARQNRYAPVRFRPRPQNENFKLCSGGEIGIRTALKMLRRKACRFESGPEHQLGNAHFILCNMQYFYAIVLV